MVVTVQQLAEWVEGEVLGDGELVVSNARPLSDAQPGDITFLEHVKRLTDLHNSKASAAIVPPGVPVNGKPLIRVSDPLMAFARVYQRLRAHPSAEAERVDPTAHIHPSAVLAEGVRVGPNTVIGEGTEVGPDTVIHANCVIGRYCKIGRDTAFHPHVVLYDDCIVGDRVTVHANAVIGADGFGYRLQQGKHVKVPQLGWVEIGDDVEIGACTTIDRGTFGPTSVGTGTKIDNLVMIAHNCQIGRHNVLAAQVGVAGSCTTGDYVVMAGQVGIADHLHIGDRAVIGAQTGVCRDIPSGQVTFGTPSMVAREFWKRWATFAKIPDLIKDVDRIREHCGLEES